MKKLLAAVASLSLAMGASVLALKAQGTSRNVWDGVYTADQATQGKALYDSKCALCHGAELTGAAFTLVSAEEEGSIRDIERGIEKRLPRVTLPDFNYQEAPQRRPAASPYHRHPSGPPRGRTGPPRCGRHY